MGPKTKDYIIKSIFKNIYFITGSRAIGKKALWLFSLLSAPPLPLPSFKIIVMKNSVGENYLSEIGIISPMFS